MISQLARDSAEFRDEIAGYRSMEELDVNAEAEMFQHWVQQTCRKHIAKMTIPDRSGGSWWNAELKGMMRVFGSWRRMVK